MKSVYTSTMTMTNIFEKSRLGHKEIAQASNVTSPKTKEMNIIETSCSCVPLQLKCKEAHEPQEP